MNTKLPAGDRLKKAKIVPLSMQAHRDEEVILFRRTVSLTSAAAATAVSIIDEDEVPTGFVPYVDSFFLKVDGATNWATTATVKIQDTNGTPVDFATIAVAALTGNAKVYPSTTNVTAEDAFIEGTGGTSGKGLQVVGDANGTGSTIKLTVIGRYVKAS